MTRHHQSHTSQAPLNWSLNPTLEHSFAPNRQVQDIMEITFFILVILLLSISIWEYFTGNVLDIAFTGILARRDEAQGKFLTIIFVQLVVWIFLLLLIFLIYGMIFETASIDYRRVRTYLLIILILIVFPFAMVRKKFASWVKETTSSN